MSYEWLHEYFGLKILALPFISRVKIMGGKLKANAVRPINGKQNAVCTFCGAYINAIPRAHTACSDQFGEEVFLPTIYRSLSLLLIYRKYNNVWCMLAGVCISRQEPHLCRVNQYLWLFYSATSDILVQDKENKFHSRVSKKQNKSMILILRENVKIQYFFNSTFIYSKNCWFKLCYVQLEHLKLKNKLQF